MLRWIDHYMALLGDLFHKELVGMLFLLFG